MVIRYITYPPNGGLECILGIIYTITSMTDPCYATMVSVTSTVILPKITVSRCVNVVAVDVVPPVAGQSQFTAQSPQLTFIVQHPHG